MKETGLLYVKQKVYGLRLNNKFCLEFFWKKKKNEKNEESGNPTQSSERRHESILGHVHR